MKKITILFLAMAATSLMLTSCQEDDDVAEVSIQGSWKIVSEFEGPVNSNLMGCELDEEVSFTASSGTFKVLDDDTVTPCTFENVPFTYILSGRDLTVNRSGPSPLTAQIIIQEITPTTLQFRIVSDSEEGVYAPDDIIVRTYERI
jgi:hypothetical protein